MKHAFIDDRGWDTQEALRWAVPLAMLLLPLGGILLLLISGVLFGEGLVINEGAPPSEPTPEPNVPPRRK